MDWAWTTSLDQFWRSPAFPMWLTLGVSGFFTLIVLVTLLRAEKSVANGALTVITLLAISVAVAATIRGFGPAGAVAPSESPSLPTMNVSLPALSCIDDLAGETVLAACEKVLFGSAESAAAAVSYAASRIAQVTASGDVAAPNGSMTPEMQALRRAVERDRYGLMAQALVARDHCTLSECAAFRALTDTHQIVANMDERMYDGLISRYAPSWNAPAAAAPVAAPVPSIPTGRPTNAEFPSAASIPPVSIMAPEPGPATPPAAPRTPTSVANAPSPSPSPSPRPTSTTGPTLAAAKKPAVPKPPRPAPAAPVQLSPATPPPPATAND
jgi:hypothetical protein